MNGMNKMPSDHTCFDFLSSETYLQSTELHGTRGFALVFHALPYTVPLVKIYM